MTVKFLSQSCTQEEKTVDLAKKDTYHRGCSITACTCDSHPDTWPGRAAYLRSIKR